MSFRSSDESFTFQRSGDVLFCLVAEKPPRTLARAAPEGTHWTSRETARTSEGDEVNSTALFHAARDVAEAMINADPIWPGYLVDQLAALVGADTVGLATNVAELADAPSANSGGPPLSVEERMMWAAHWWQYPFFERLLLTGEGTAARNSDLVGSMRAFRRTTVYGEHFEPRHARYQANLGWKTGDDLALVGLYRERRDFDLEELAELERVRQLFAATAEYCSVLDRLGAPRVEVDRPGPEATLSRRQQVVLALVATGATNGQIATQLRITERTVRKHVEDICRKLRVSNRVAAARWWLTSARGGQQFPESSPAPFGIGTIRNQGPARMPPGQAGQRDCDDDTTDVRKAGHR